jgi:hypothetical protein
MFIPKKVRKYHFAISIVLLLWVVINFLGWEGLPINYWGQISLSISLFLLFNLVSIAIYIWAIVKNSTRLKISTAIIWVCQIPAYWLAIKFYGPACCVNYFQAISFVLTLLFPVACIPLLIVSHEQGANA